jgi:hypothetical protein
MRYRWIVHALILLAIFVIGFGPWVLVAGAGLVADSNGCQLDEGGPHPCIINGTDYGETLYSLGLMGWVGLATCPLSILLVAIYLGVLLVLYLVRRNKQPHQRVKKLN